MEVCGDFNDSLLEASSSGHSRNCSFWCCLLALFFSCRGFTLITQHLILLTWYFTNQWVAVAKSVVQIEMLCNSWMDRHNICSRNSSSLGDDVIWLCWSLQFSFSNTNNGSNSSLIQWTLDCLYWMDWHHIVGRNSRFTGSLFFFESLAFSC